MPARTITVTLEHDFTDTVYLKTDPDQLQRIVTDIRINPSGLVLYFLCCGPSGSWHYDFEITDTKILTL